ncbi:unnamed protein product (macronuclear) [Paramecium tetraurelia]|uniref:Uncharacterized protein n=1 Tax=Paramecium tetraurelia TaxID=5888 RepID=A0DTN6_PARTE|nr:uncharacterized protein GSPATT00020084001 [Paramecium tetraurelia]CAK86403.1 unnamed protein product [Paramecium tetraurelia]|eukprot:XP_001453800.1 hypothetical protein (macronuclear) [Paramecium tetraurelia strain d4-2]
MYKKQTRPLFIPKPENGEFPFDIKNVNTNDVKPIDFFRMYNSLQMMVEKLIQDQTVQQKVSTNIDAIFRVFIEKDLNPPPPQKLVGRRSSPYTYQKQEFWLLVEHLNSLGFSYKQISERLQVHYVQISTHHRNTVDYDDDSEQESSQVKKSIKEKSKQVKIIEKQPIQNFDVFQSDDEQGSK